MPSCSSGLGFFLFSSFCFVASTFFSGQTLYSDPPSHPPEFIGISNNTFYRNNRNKISLGNISHTRRGTDAPRKK
jgi:hypothetical protein